MAIATGNPEACGFDDDGRDKDEFFFDFISNSIYPALAAMAISANQPPLNAIRLWSQQHKTLGGNCMPKYVMERDIPNVGDVTREQVIALSTKVVQRAA